MTATSLTVAPFEYSLRVPHDARAVGVARAALRATLGAHDLSDLTDRAELLVSELLTNSYRYSEGAAQLRLKWSAETLRMTVWDSSPTLPAPREAEADHESGRGLLLLGALADRWAHYPLPETPEGTLNKVVWCEIGRTPPAGW